MVYTASNFTIEVGTFGEEKGMLEFSKPTLVVPFTQAPLRIGLASSDSELAFSEGKTLDYVGILSGELKDGPIKGTIRFWPRPCYDGQKIIIPRGVNSVNALKMDDTQGLLNFCGETRYNKLSVEYTHLSESHMTRFFESKEGLLENTVKEMNQKYDLGFPSNKMSSEKIILLGAKSESQNPKEAIPQGFYYVRILKEKI
ncbi:MAG: hypothetical protein Q8O89_01335 [Nanoarchaeota archaeon]|nr:hypothetical protein [Nanoarchaeota archaeon]